MVASLSIAKIDLNWADNQYWSTLFKVIREKNKMLKPIERKKVTSQQMAGFIRKE